MSQIRCAVRGNNGEFTDVILHPKSIFKVEKTIQKTPKKSAMKEGFIFSEKYHLIQCIEKRNETIGIGRQQLLEGTRQLQGIREAMVAEPRGVANSLDQLAEKLCHSTLMDMEIAIHVILHAETIGGAWAAHSMRVAVLAMLLAKQMGFNHQSMKWVGIGALFHDVGYNDLPIRIREKNEPLTAVE